MIIRNIPDPNKIGSIRAKFHDGDAYFCSSACLEERNKIFYENEMTTDY